MTANEKQYFAKCFETTQHHWLIKSRKHSRQENHSWFQNELHCKWSHLYRRYLFLHELIAKYIAMVLFFYEHDDDWSMAMIFSNLTVFWINCNCLRHHCCCWHQQQLCGMIAQVGGGRWLWLTWQKNVIIYESLWLLSYYSHNDTLIVTLNYGAVVRWNMMHPSNMKGKWMYLDIYFKMMLKHVLVHTNCGKMRHRRKQSSPYSNSVFFCQ